MSTDTTSNSESHEPPCPPESRCVKCWEDDDAVIKALVAERDKIATDYTDYWDWAQAQIERLTREMEQEKCVNAELAQARQMDGSEHWARISGDWSRRCGEMQAERDRLRAAQAEAVRILAAVEFDGQAYDAITKATTLLSGERIPDETRAPLADHYYRALLRVIERTHGLRDDDASRIARDAINYPPQPEKAEPKQSSEQRNEKP